MLDEGSQDMPVETGQPIFWMPLNTHAEPGREPLEGFNDPICGPRDNVKAALPDQSVLMQTIDPKGLILVVAHKL